MILDSLLSKWNRRWHVSLDSAQSEWLLSRHNHYFRCRSFKKYVSKEKGLQKVEGMVYNAGREGGLVGVECSSWRENTYFNAFVEAGEAKRFSVVRSLNVVSNGICIPDMHTILVDKVEECGLAVQHLLVCRRYGFLYGFVCKSSACH